MIIVTGAAGFIGSALVQKLNNEGLTDLILVDEFSREDKVRNFKDKAFTQALDRDLFIEWLSDNTEEVEVIFHMGARTDTTEKDKEIFDKLNLHYSQSIWEICSKAEIPLIYASSAATYGLGEYGYIDSHDIIEKLKPLNPYGNSKNDFDIWALKQELEPPYWAGLKFFNVYGPNEYHKGRMASVIFHTHKQIQATGGMKLFRSHRDDFADGEQSRDFIYIKDVLNIIWYLYSTKKVKGLVNVGTGKARSFYDLAANTFRAMELEPNISFIDTPEDIRDTYQYFTEANMKKLLDSGYDKPFYSLEDGIHDYVTQYLEKKHKLF